MELYNLLKLAIYFIVAPKASLDGLGKIAHMLELAREFDPEYSLDKNTASLLSDNYQRLYSLPEDSIDRQALAELSSRYSRLGISF